MDGALHESGWQSAPRSPAFVDIITGEPALYDTGPGRRTAVQILGTLNDSSDTDQGWTVELAFPWQGLVSLAKDGRALPPREGDVWRTNGLSSLTPVR